MPNNRSKSEFEFVSKVWTDPFLGLDNLGHSKDNRQSQATELNRPLQLR